MNTLINSILSYLDQNKALLAADKWSGVYKVDGVYRVHLLSFSPRMINYTRADINVSDVIAEECKQFPNMTWDPQTLWLTIENHKE